MEGKGKATREWGIAGEAPRHVNSLEQRQRHWDTQDEEARWQRQAPRRHRRNRKGLRVHKLREDRTRKDSVLVTYH